MKLSIKSTLTKIKSKVKIKKSGKYLKINGKTCKTAKDFLKNVKKIAVEDNKKRVQYGDFCSATLKKLREEICKSQIKPTSADEAVYKSFLESVETDYVTSKRIIDSLKENKEQDKIFDGGSIIANSMVFYILRKYNLEHKDDEEENLSPMKNEKLKKKLEKTMSIKHKMFESKEKLISKEEKKKSKENSKLKEGLNSKRQSISSTTPIKVGDQEFKNARDLRQKTAKDIENLISKYKEMSDKFTVSIKNLTEKIEAKFPEVYEKCYHNDEYQSEIKDNKNFFGNMDNSLKMILKYTKKEDSEKQNFRNYTIDGEHKIVKSNVDACIGYWKEREGHVSNLKGLNDIYEGNIDDSLKNNTKTDIFTSAIKLYKLIQELTKVASCKSEEEAFKEVPKNRFNSEYKKTENEKDNKEKSSSEKKDNKERLTIKKGLNSIRQSISPTKPIKIGDQEFKNAKDLQEKTAKDAQSLHSEYKAMVKSYMEAINKAEQELEHKYPRIYKKFYESGNYPDESGETKTEIQNMPNTFKNMIKATKGEADLKEEERYFRRYSRIGESRSTGGTYTNVYLGYWKERKLYVEILENLNNILKGQYKKEWETDKTNKTSGLRSGIHFYKLIQELTEITSCKSEEEALKKVPKKRFKSEYKKVNPNSTKGKDFLNRNNSERKRIKEKIENSIKSGNYEKEDIIELIKKYAKFEATDIQRGEEELVDLLLEEGTVVEDTEKEKKLIKSISENLKVSNLKDYVNHTDFKGQTIEGNEIKEWLEKIK